MGTLTKKPIQVYLESRQAETLRWLADKKGVSVAELVRRSVDCYLAQLPPEEDPLWGIIGLGKSGLGDLAERHDYYLYEEPYEKSRGEG
ncbi:MAG: ribbon-helix-helix protein, CopG family [Chloroflexi bacterium]|nr:ribbon-helix-helix protein, CopG family [Chloroflexota bacterium]